MESYLIYIGKAAMAAGAFYLAYLVLFQNQKQFVFNRIYLPVSLALSFIIPLITFTTVKYIEAPAADPNSFAFLSQAAVATETYSESPSLWPDYLFGLYLLGVAGFSFHLLTGHFNAIRMVQKSYVKNLFGSQVHITKKDVHPFSFFNKIVLSEKTMNSPNLKMIVAHESIHVKEKHTLDILFAEVLFLVQWFNPFAWLLKDAVKNNLEYKTDHEIVKTNDPQTYQLAMVALADKKGVAPFLTALNGSQLKNRIIMMKKKTENKFAPLKQLVILPLLAVLVMGLSNKEVKTEIVQQKVEQHALSAEIQEERTITGKVTDKNGLPLKDASILVVSTQTTTTSDSDGTFEVQTAIENETLVFGKSGYKTLETQTSGRNLLVVELEIENRLHIVDDEEIHGEIEDIDPENIKSIDVLKGESGTRLYGEKGKNGVIVIQTKSGNDSNSGYSTRVDMDTKSQNQVDSKVDVMPEFPGGEIALKKYIDNRIVYPKRALEKGIIGTVYVEFVITKSGKVKDAKIARGVDPDLNKEALRVVNTLPLWKPGRENGKPVDVTYTVPVEFNIKGFPHKIKSTAGELIVTNPLYIVDDKEVEDITELDPNNIESISVLKDKSASDLYGKKGKNGVIIIQTKNYKKNSQNELPVVLNGKLTQLTLNEVDRDLIQNIKRIEPVDAVKKYGEKGKNGVFEITSRNVYTDKVKVKSSEEFKNENITTPLELRKYIARNIKYPKEAVETNTDGTTSFLIRVDNNGNIFDIMKPGRADIGLETVVVTAEKTKKPGRYIKNKNQSLLTNEVKRVIEKTPKIQIPEFKGKTVQVSVKFVLQ